MKTGGFKTKNCNKSIIFALLMVTILFMSTGLAAAKEATVVVKNADTPANRVVIYGTFVPETINIHTGENVTWVNFKKPKAPTVLVSAEGLWEETTLYYGKAFSYTFEEQGTYVFTLKDNPEIKGSVTVHAPELQKEDSETPSEAAIVEKPQVQPEAPSSTKDLEKNDENEENSHHEEKIVIYSTTFVPELIEIKKGDTISWVNFKRPKGPSVLVSEDGLWENKSINYGKIFSYTFEKTGTYTFSLESMPETKATVIVK